ncbi:MAG: ATP-dependent helicase [Candidatus Doudnabacteria bacterium]|nr:ATP-dependent helicase [Candidatus Doudnabacteria bacterium]
MKQVLKSTYAKASVDKQKNAVLEGLNKQQEKAVTFSQGPLLIIAGAGTGKTTVLTRRISWLIQERLAKPDEILALTFTEKAAAEMEERVDRLMELGYSEIDISTFHAFGQKILQEHALDIGLPGDFKVITETQAWMLLKKHLHEIDLDYYRPIGNPNKFIHALLKHFNKAKGEEITTQAYLDYASGLKLNNDNNLSASLETDDDNDSKRIREAANAYHFYQKLLLDGSFLDFGDLINYTLKLFRDRPKILKLYQEKYKYILVDEFQDTDLAQFELVKLLSLPQNNITVVGDDDQSIYKFRGASVSNILKFKEDFPKAAEITLTQNYRSTQNILDLAYNFIQLNNPERLESKLKVSKKLISQIKDKGSIEVIHAKTGFDEAKIVADKILELMEKENLTLNNFAILTRANDSAEPFIAELARRGITYMFVANRGLYKKPLILDILSYFRLLDNYHESENLFRVLNIQKFKIDEHDLIGISQTAKRKSASVFEVLKNINSVSVTADTRQKTADLLRLIEKHCVAAREKPVTEVLIKILDDLGILKKLSEDSSENVENRSLLEQFYKKAQGYESENTDKSLKGFLNLIKLELEAGDEGQLAFNPDLGPEAVRIMTVHAAKGLEFHTVFIINMVDQRFPSRDRKEQIEIPQTLVKEILPEGDVHLMEERRLFYVAMTRAKKNLFLTWSDDYGGVSAKKPSRFLVEINLVSAPHAQAPSGEVFFAQQPALKLQIPDSKFQIPDTFSYSQINCFRNCPLEYKYRYIYHLPTPGQGQLTFGDTMHKTLEKFLQNYKQINAEKQQDLFGSKKNKTLVPPKETLFRFYEQTWSDDWFLDSIQKQNYLKLGYKMLENFYDKFSQSPKPIEFLEQRFKLKIGDYKFVGKIDRADLNPDGSVDIIDYKTGRSKLKLTSDDKAQLLIYQWAAEEEFTKKVKGLSYWFLDTLREPVSFLGGKDEVDGIKKKILETIGEIIEAVKANSFSKLDLKKSHDCRFRDFAA